MFTKIAKVVLFITLSFALSCSKKVKPDAEGAGDGVGSSSPGGIVKEDMNFPAAGSDTGQINGLSSINFGYDSSILDQASRDTLKANAAWINANSKVTVQIEGHCDSRGSVEYNLALGERRAKTVRDYLTSIGVDGKRLNVISYGKEKPLEIGDSEAVNSKNRRANFVPLVN